MELIDAVTDFSIEKDIVRPEYEVSDSEYLTEGNENYPSSHPMMDEYGAGQTQGHLFDKDDAIEGE